MSSMTKEKQQRTAVLQGTLDMLILRTLIYGAAHGHQIGKHIQRTTNDFLQMQHGSLYPALHRLEKRGWVVSKWETSPDRKREFKYYRLTEKGIALAPLLLDLLIWGARHEETAAPCGLSLQLEKNREELLLETHRRWAQHDATPLIPPFRPLAEPAKKKRTLTGRTSPKAKQK